MAAACTNLSRAESTTEVTPAPLHCTPYVQTASWVLHDRPPKRHKFKSYDYTPKLDCRRLLPSRYW